MTTTENVPDTMTGPTTTKTGPRLKTRYASEIKPALHEQLRSLGFEVIGNGPDGLRRRIELEVPAYRDLIVKVGIEPV